MNAPPQTFEAVLRVIYEYYLRALLDDDVARKWARDEPCISLGAAPAFRRVGGRAWWLDRDPNGPDDPAWVIAEIDEASGLFHLAPATAGEARGLPRAEEFDPQGEPLDGEPIA